MNTKERIACEALTLFSSKGYSAVSVRDIARAAGIKESSIYNHYKGKQAIFDALEMLFSASLLRRSILRETSLRTWPT